MPDLPLITSEGFAGLGPEWIALHRCVPGATPFQHPAWHATWLKHFGGGCLPVYLAVRRGDALIGVAPLDMATGEARELGDPNVRDYGGPLALPGEEEAVAAAILEWLREDLTRGLCCWGIAADSAMVGAFTSAARLGWTIDTGPEAVCPSAELPGSFDAFVAGLGKKDRHELRRKMRNFEAAGRAEFSSVTAAPDVAGQMPRFLELMRLSRDDKEEFLTPTMERFFADVASTFAALGMARLSTLSLDGSAVAMTFAFEDDRAAYLYNSGYDPACAHLSVGLVSKAYAIREAIADGKDRFDFLRGAEEYKHRLGGIDRQLVTLWLRE